MQFLNSIHQKTLLKIPIAWPLRRQVYNAVLEVASSILEVASRIQSLPFASAKCHKATGVFVGGVI